ncbi:hypothetical protein KCU62_g8076, partial [Aureobasidium sp. EXF-3399]
MAQQPSKFVSKGQAYSSFQTIAREGYRIDANIAQYHKLTQDIKAKGNLQTPAGLTLQDSERELQAARNTQSYLAGEAVRISDQNHALDILNNNLVEWLKTATYDQNYNRTTVATNYVSQLVETFASFIKADMKNKHKAISRDDIGKLVKALGVAQVQALPTSITPQDDTEALVLQGVSGEFASHNQFTIKEVLSVATEWMSEAAKCGDKVQTLLKRNAEKKEELRILVRNKSELDEEVQRLGAAAAQKDTTITELKAAAEEYRLALQEAHDQHEEVEAVLQRELQEAVAAADKVKKDYDWHIKNVGTTDSRDAALVSEFRKAIRSARVTPPLEVTTPLAYLTHFLDELVESRESSEMYEAMKEEHAECEVNAQRMQDDNDDFQERLDKMTDIATDAQKQNSRHTKSLSRHQKVMSEQTLELIEYDNKAKSDSEKIAGLESENSSINARLQDKLTKIQNLNGIVTSYKSVSYEFRILATVLGLDVSPKPAQITAAVTKLLSKVQQQQSTTSETLKERALAAEAELRVYKELDHPARIATLEEQLEALAKKEKVCSNELTTTKRDLKVSRASGTAQASKIDELSQLKSQDAVKIATLEASIEHCKLDNARLNKQHDKLENKLDSAQRENEALSQTASNLRERQVNVVADVQAKLDKALETSRQLERDLNASEEKARTFCSHYDGFKVSVMGAINYTDEDKSPQQIFAALQDLAKRLGAVRTALKTDHNVDIADHITRNLHTKESVNEEVRQALKPLREHLYISEQEDLSEAIQSLVKEKSDALVLLEEIDLPDDLSDTQSEVTAKINIISDAVKKLQNAIGTYDTTSAYVDEVERLKRSDQLAKAMENALEGVATNACVDKINELKTKHTALQTIYDALNVTTPLTASSLINSLKADGDNMSAVRSTLEVTTNDQALQVITKHKNDSAELQKICVQLLVATDQAVSTVTGKLWPGFQELELIYKALDHSADGTAPALVEDLQKVKTEHTQIINELGSSFQGTAIASIKALNTVKREHERIYKALGLAQGRNAVEFIGTLTEIKTEHDRIYAALGASGQGKAVRLINDLNKIKTEHGTIFATLGASEKDKAIELIVDSKKTKTEHDLICSELDTSGQGKALDAIKSLKTSKTESTQLYQEIKGQKQRICNALELPEDSDATDAVKSLKDVKTEYQQIYKALGAAEGKALKSIDALQQIETKYDQIYHTLNKPITSRSAVTAILVLRDVEDAYDNLRKLISDNDKSSSTEAVIGLRAVSADYSSLTSRLSADNNDGCIAEIDQLKNTKEAFDALAQLLPGRDSQDNQSRIQEITRLQESDEAFASLINALPPHVGAKHVEEAERLRQNDTAFKALAELLPGQNSRDNQLRIDAIKQLQQRSMAFDSLVSALPVHETDNHIGEIERLKSIEEKIVQDSPINNQDPITEVERLKTADDTLGRIRTILTLAPGENPITKINTHNLASATLDAVKAKLGPLQRPVQDEVEGIKVQAATAGADLDKVDQALGLGDGRGRVQVIGELRSGLEGAKLDRDKYKKERDEAQKELLAIGNAMGPASKASTLAGVVTSWKTELGNITAELEPISRRTRVQAIQDIKTELAQTKIDRDTHQNNDRQAQAAITAVNQELDPLDDRTPVQAIQDIKVELAQLKKERATSDQDRQKLESDLYRARRGSENYRRLYKEMSNIKQGLGMGDRTLSEAVRDLSNRLTAAESARDTQLENFDNAQAHIADIEKKLDLTGGRTVLGAIDDLKQALSQATTSQDKLQDEIDVILDQINQPGLSLGQAVQHLQDRIRAFIDEMDGIDEELKKALGLDERVTPELLTAVGHLALPDVSLVSLNLLERLITLRSWADGNNALPYIVTGWQLVTSVTTRWRSCTQVITVLRFLLLSDTEASMQLVQVLFSSPVQCSIKDLTRLVDLLEVHSSSGPSLVDEVHAFVTARMLEFIIRELPRLDHAEPQVSRLIESWTRIYQTAPLTMPRIFEELQESAAVQTMQEATSLRVFYCNVLPGYHLVVDGHALELFEEEDLEVDLILCRISFPEESIPAFTTNLELERVNPMIRLHMRSLWLRGTV